MTSQDLVYLARTSERSYACQEAQARGVKRMFAFELFKLTALWSEGARSPSQA